jgi:hypothetical protein
MQGGRYTNIEQIRKQIGSALSDRSIVQNLKQSTDGVIDVLLAIGTKEKDQWATHVKGLTPTEQQQFTEAFRPHVDSIRTIFHPSASHPPMRGGQAAAKAPTSTSSSTSLEPTFAEQANMSEEEVQSKLEQSTGKSSDPTSDPETMTGLDNIYAKVMQRIGQVNSVVDGYASQYGVLKLEKQYDMDHDIRLIPDPVILFLEPVTGPAASVFLKKIKVSFRTIVFVVYLVLDVARITAAVAGSDYNRKVLSVMVSLLELLRGDWKKAILSFMGFYGMTPLLIGQQVKIFLTLFRMLSPTLQDTFIYGAFDATKSFFIGLLLTIFQITAPEEVRAPLIGILEKIARKKAEIDGILIDAELSARADHFAPTFEDFNNIQSLMDDPEFICSTEYEKLIEIINTTSVINMILQILRIPVSKEFRAYRCGTKPSKPFITLLVDQSKKDKEKEKLAEPISNANTQMPISAGQGDGAAPVAEETPQEAAEETPQEAAAETPVETPVETPQEATAETPVETPEEATPVEEEKPVEAVEEKPEEKPVALHAPIGSKQEKPAEAVEEKPTLHAPTGSAQTQSVKKGGLRQTKKRRVRASSSL